jgi:LCP family protein required for cell wall assembly
MPNKKPFPAQPAKPVAQRPGHNAATLQQSPHFPAVGMTLSSYKHSPFASGQAPESRTLPKSAPPNRLKRAFSKITIKRTAITLSLLVLISVGWIGGKFVYNTHKVFGGNILSVLSTTKLKGEDHGRVNILLAGNSSDDAGHSGAELTDSIMLLSIDTKNHSIFMMSIPRDLWVNIGDYGYSKINYAYVYGNKTKFSSDGFPNGGMGQLESVLEENLSIDINYYALVNYQALKDAVDAVGGVDFTVASSDKRGLFDPNIDYSVKGGRAPLVKLTNGLHHLNGQQALNLSRARGDSAYSYGFPRSDFDRTENQRKLLVSLKAKVVTAGTLASPTKLSSLSDVLGHNVKSDLKINEVRRMYDIVKDVGGSNITSVGLNSANGKNLLTSYTSPDGQSALTPAAGINDYTNIQDYIKQITSNNPVVREGAQTVLLNGTNTVGFATAQKSALEAKELQVVAIGDATDTAVTTIIDDSAGKYPGTIAFLKKQYPKAVVTTTSTYTKQYNADIIVVLGTDALPKKATTSQTTQ